MTKTFKEAVIGTDGKIRCPYCFKTNGMANDDAFIKNYIMRCRGSRRGRGAEHYFVVNYNGKKEGGAVND